MTHDYKRNGTTTLFAALNILDGTVLGRCMQKHRHQEFIKFLNAVERSVPAGKIIHAIPRLREDKLSTITPPTSTPRSRNGWPITPAGSFTSRPHPRPGSTPSRASFPSSHDGASVAASSDPSPNSKMPSAATSAITTATPSPLSGRKPPKKFATNSIACLHHLNESVH